ncbi:MAG: restriction endonuclease subunit S [Aphanothece sp. CMT-3BRIN-NPC111]|jgi:hypothetical protein|nr:restriction endonuclease subunit S [Aphanothece sp. CMT-3BRIN-NPC111]
MPIPSKITALVDRVNQELNQLEQLATEGLTLTRVLLARFGENARFIQFFASFSSAMLFVETEKRRLRSIVKNLSITDVTTDEEIQEAGEDLATELGRVLETKMLIGNLKNRLENLQ